VQPGTGSPNPTLLKRLLRDWEIVLGGAVVAALALAALFAPLLAPYHYAAQDLRLGFQNAPPSSQHLLGTDDLGRDIFSRLLYGARVSLAIAAGVQLVDLVVGAGLGLASGYYGGRLDQAIMRVTDVMFAFPDLLLAILIMAIAPPSLLNVFIALGAVSWPTMARLVRGQAMALREQEFVEAAKALGAGGARIVFKHLLPNLMGPAIVAMSTGMAAIILAEATLSFLGIGVQPPYPSWGSMINAGMGTFRSYPLQVLFPALTLASTVLAFNLLADGLRDRLDPRMRGMSS
jgi:ABC-type dipeptide/oligopeptide/nickel transport system permease subunit